METAAILNQRRAILVQLIKECHSWVTKYSCSGDESLCKELSNKEVCNALILGYLVIQLQRVQLWPGTPEAIANRMETKSIADVYGAIKKIHDYMRPKDGSRRSAQAAASPNSMDHHLACGCTSALLEAVKPIVDAERKKCIKMPEPVKERFKKQREKQETTNIDASRFLRRGPSKSS